MLTMTREQIERGNMSKMDLARILELKTNYREFDYAIPQAWLDEFCYRAKLDYNAVRQSTFWVYPKNNFMGHPISAWDKVQKEIEKQPF